MSKLWITIILLLGVAVIGSNSLVLSPILTDVAADLQTSTIAVARAIAAYGGATAVSALFLGFTVDRFGARSVLLVGGLGLAVSMLVCALSTSWQMLVAGQAVAGLAAGVMLPAIYAVATTTGSEDEGSRILGRVLTGWSVSLIAGVPVSALIAERFSWEVSFFTLAVLVLVSLVGFWTMPRRDSQLLVNTGNPLKAIAIPDVGPLLVTQFFFMTAFYGTYAFFGDQLRASLDISTGVAGVVVLSYGVGFGLAALADGLIDRVGPARVLPGALVCVVIIYGVMPVLVTSLGGAVAAAFAWGFVNHFVVNVIVLRLSRISGDQRGAVLGLNSAITYFGALIGALVLGQVYGNLGFAGLVWGAASCVTLGCLTLLVPAMMVRRRRFTPLPYCPPASSSQPCTTGCDQ